MLAGRRDPLAVTDRQVSERGARYIDFLIPGLLGMNLMGSGIWGVGFAIVEFGDVRIDLARRTVEREGRPLHLTPIEYRLLTHLADLELRGLIRRVEGGRFIRQ